MTRCDGGARRHHRAGADQTVVADAAAVEDDRADAAQTAIADRTAVQHRVVAHRDVVAEDGRMTLAGDAAGVVLMFVRADAM
jgi:hypothetical protein